MVLYPFFLFHVKSHKHVHLFFFRFIELSSKAQLFRGAVLLPSPGMFFILVYLCPSSPKTLGMTAIGKEGKQEHPLQQIDTGSVQ